MFSFHPLENYILQSVCILLLFLGGTPVVHHGLFVLCFGVAFALFMPFIYKHIHNELNGRPHLGK